MNTLVCSVVLVVAVLAAGVRSQRDDKWIPIATVGAKTFYMIDGEDYDNWEGVVFNCEEEQAIIPATVENQAESDALAAFSLKRAQQGKPSNVWIGAIFQNDKWIWYSTGKELTYQNWKPNAKLKPDNNEQICGYIGAGYQWEAHNCQSNLGVPVCQKP